MAKYLRERHPPIKAGDRLRGSNIFPYDTRGEMLNVHLFFLKLFGGLILEGGGHIPLDITPFADAIMNGRAHPEVYLQVGSSNAETGRSNVQVTRVFTGHVLALWLYRVGGYAVNVMFAQEAGGWEGLSGTWHPRFGASGLNQLKRRV
jgi:hypothetical protein